MKKSKPEKNKRRMTKIGVKRLLRVADQISENPENFTMEHFACGTAHCIAGQLAANEGWKKAGTTLSNSVLSINMACKKGRVVSDWELVASKLLGFAFFQDSEKLFFLSYWPLKYSTAYRKAGSAEEKASIAVHWIHIFIKEHGPLETK